MVRIKIVKIIPNNLNHHSGTKYCSIEELLGYHIEKLFIGITSFYSHVQFD